MPPEAALIIIARQQIVEGFVAKSRARKFRAGSWQRNSGKLDFLDIKLRDELAKTFNMVEEFNRAIDDSRRFKSSSYLMGIPTEKLKESLGRSRQGLEEWFQANPDQAMTTPGRRGCLSP